MRPLEALRSLPDRQASSGPVGLARAGVGAAAVIEAFEVASELRVLHTPGLVRLPRFESLPTVPLSGAGLLLGIWIAVALAFCLGWHTRVAGVVLTGLLGYVLALDQQLYSNHLYLMTLLTLLLTLAGSGAAFSLDARREGTRELIPAWPVILLMLQVSIVYGFAAASKLNLIYLSGLVLRVQLRIPGLESVPPAIFSLAALVSVATEIFLAVAFWNKRLRPLAFLVGAGFHLTIIVTVRVLPDLIAFALLMFSAYLSYLSTISEPGSSLRRRPRVESAARA